MGLLHRIARARLASQVIRRLRRAGVTDARYLSAGFAVRFTRPGADEPTLLPLDSLLAGRSPGRRARRERIQRFVAGYLDAQGVPSGWDEVRARLRPLLRPSHLRGGIPASGPDAPLRRSRLPFLSEFVVVDEPETMTYVGADQLAGWGVPADEVFRAARGNLTGAVLQGAARSPVVVQFTEDENAYWTSHLLLDGWLARLAPQVGGVPVAFAPDHGTLIVAAEDSAHLPELFARAEVMYLASPRAITPMAYVSDGDGRTVPYAVAPGHPVHDCIRRAETIQRVQEYTRQAASLPGAAPLRLVDGLRTRTASTPDALLPAADEVEVDGKVTPWADLAERLTPVAGIDPPRWTLSS
ncbi:hypothetical protein AB0M20_22700 [Actinoplanes sp. NPDC051633]|uniref:hypothetical protein n=1 Tax=Actinoplanes sp. NPDC051633 TaxID=3155670 RepID=UPI003426AC9C